MRAKTSFWNLPPSNKWNILNDKAHYHILLAALADPETRVRQQNDTSFIIYGDDEAILFVVDKKSNGIALRVLEVILDNIRRASNEVD